MASHRSFDHQHTPTPIAASMHSKALQSRPGVSECVHTDTIVSPSTRMRVPRNTSLHVFQWRPFTLIRVLYEYGLPVNFSRTSSFCAGRVFIQTVLNKQHKICINLYRPRRIYDVRNSVIVELLIVTCVRLVKLLTM